MSINHSFQICEAEGDAITINIARLDSESQDESSLIGTLYAFCGNTGASRFTCKFGINDLRGLYNFLHQYSVVRDTGKTSTGKFIEVDSSIEEAAKKILISAQKETVLHVLQDIVASKLTKDDMNILLGRRKSLDEFEDMLRMQETINEPEWQKFFEKNEWIFGYGLEYRYLKILQREAHISNTDLDGSNDVISDFLMTDSQYTKLVELKKPTTPLFENRKNRSDSWCLSHDLANAVSQILAQKANWELEATRGTYDGQGNKITDGAYDVKCMLIIGSREQITGSDREKDIKRKTLELYRRNMRNIEIILYDELLDRARFIVNRPINERMLVGANP